MAESRDKNMINYTERLDSAIRKAAWAHEQQGQHRKGTDIPYVIHPYGVMLIASNATDDEDVLIACLFHDIIEDVDSSIYSEAEMRKDFGDRVTDIVKDVSKNDDIDDWHERGQAYLDHLEQKGSDEAVIVSAADKIHNLTSMIIDYRVKGDKLWDLFKTKSKDDQLWWYDSVFELVKRRLPDSPLVEQLENSIAEIKQLVN